MEKTKMSRSVTSFFKKTRSLKNMYTLFMCRLCGDNLWITGTRTIWHNCRGAYNPPCDHHPEDDETCDVYLRFQRQPDGGVKCMGRSIYSVHCECDAGEEMEVVQD